MSAPPLDGGRAFPYFLPKENGNFEIGMSLRDYFAARLAQGIMAASIYTGSELPDGFHWESLAQMAYKGADAMLKARQE